jgi:galactose mutarotase-like enzyme
MLHTIKNDFLTVTAQEAGAQLLSVLGADGTEYLWQGDSKYWSDRSPNLFPYVGRLKEGHYYVDGESHQMRIHGIAPYRDFRLVSNNGNEMVLELTDDAETLAQYPRRFAFRVIYRLDGSTLEVCYEVENRDEKTMYFGLGGHPGFQVPLVRGKSFEDYRLRFGEVTDCQEVILTPDCFITDATRPFPLEEGCILPLRHSLFDNDAIVLTSMAHSITLEAEGDPHSVTVSYPQMPYLGLWHRPHTDAPYVCIEPWCSLPSGADGVTVLEEKKDLLFLEAGDTYQNRWSIQVGSR